MTSDFIERFLKDYFGFKPNCLYINDNEDFPYVFFANDINETKDEGSYLDESGEFEGHLWSCYCGVSKMCIVFEDFDEVIKIPFDGRWNCREDKDDEYVFCEYADYIRVESDMYECASEALKKILLPNEFIMRFGRLKVYTQKKIGYTYNDYYLCIKCSEEEEHKELVPEKFEKAIKRYKRLSPVVDKLPKDGFLASIVEKFPHDAQQIIRELDFDDLHENNYGYLKNGMPVLFDYGGFVD